MSLLSLVLPIAGQADSTEDVKVTSALTAIQTWANGNVDATNLANAVTAAYTPVLTGSVSNPVIGNGTLAGHSFAIGTTVLVRIYLAIGSTTTLGSGNWALTLPVAAKSDASTQALTGMMNPGGSVFIGVWGQLFAGGTSIALWSVSGSRVTNASSFASGNVLALQGVYESA